MNAPQIPDTGDYLAQLLLATKLVDEKQLKHAQRVRGKLANNKTLLKTLLELEYFTQKQFNEALSRGCHNVRLGDLLVEMGDLTIQELDTALRVQRGENESGRNRRLGEILVELRFLREQRLIEVLSSLLGFPRVEPDFAKIDRRLLMEVPADWCERHQLIPVRKEGDRILVACSDPSNPEIQRVAELLLNGKVQLGISSEYTLKIAINKYKSMEDGALRETGVEESKVVRMVDEVLQAAIAVNASDIHCEPMSDKLHIRFRRDGVLLPYKDFLIDIAPAFISRLKILAKANIAERRRHQDGKIEFNDSQSGQIIDVRCSFYVSIYGEKACLRLLNRKAVLLDVEEIGMAPAVLDRFKYDALEVASGVLLVTGPTGSGKTTTLYACVDYLKDDETSIITAEEPVEYVIDGITQCSLNPKIDMTFAESLRHMVRQDPDVIVLGEIRDAESASSAIQAAMTGHKVLTTFHTEDTIGALLRLMNMNIETFLISSTVVAVLAQRLLRRVCPNCGQPHRPTPQEMQRAGLRPEELRRAEFKLGVGCDACQYTGYSGRVSIFELLVLDDHVKDAVLNRKAAYDIRRIAIESTGLVTLFEDGLEKASRGLTTLNEVLRNLPRTERPRTLAEIRRLSGYTHGR